MSRPETIPAESIMPDDGVYPKPQLSRANASHPQSAAFQELQARVNQLMREKDDMLGLIQAITKRLNALEHRQNVIDNELSRRPVSPE